MPNIISSYTKTIWIYFRRTSSRTLIVTLVLFLACYICANVGFTFFNDNLVIRLVQLINAKKQVPDNVLLLDVQYDLQLAKKSLMSQDVGYVAITDRHKLYDLLHKLDSVGTYHYIFMDVGFWKGETTEYDSTLFDLIRTMPRIVIADCGDMEDGIGLNGKAGKVAYSTTFLNSDFSKIPIVDVSGNISFAARAYEECSGRHIKSFLGLFCMDDSQPAMRCISPKPRLFLTTEGSPTSDSLDLRGDYALVNSDINLLGSEFLHDFDLYYVTPEQDWIKGMDIIIGDFSKDDEHPTIFGKTYGAIINYNTYLALCNKDHILHWYQILAILLSIYALTLHTEKQVGIRNSRRNSWVKIFPSVILVWFISFALYLLLGQTFDFIIVVIGLGIYSRYFKFLHTNETSL